MSSAALSSEESSGSEESPRLVRVELLVGGMTCAACAAKVENKLNALENVSATVNYATEKATVTAPVSVPVQRFVEEIQRAGYAADVAAADTGQADAGGGMADAARVAYLRRRLIVALVFFVPLSDLSVLLSLFPAYRFPRRAGAVEQASEHAVAAAITAACGELGPLPHAAGFTALPGLGARGVVDGHAVIVGREKLFRDRGLDIPAELAAPCAAWERAGHTVVLAGWDGQVRGAIAVADTIKPSAAAAVQALRRLGLRTILLTGDNQATAAAVAADAGTDEVIAGALPADKVALITGLQAQGRSVAMVGDGVNDAPALAAADLGLAIGSGTDAAICAADMILLRDDLGAVPDAIKLARATLATIRRNLAWAFGYNVAAIPLAAAGFLNPLIAGAAMAGSSAFVVGNSVRPRRFGLPSTARHPERRTAAPVGDNPPGDGSQLEEQAASCLE